MSRNARVSLGNPEPNEPGQAHAVAQRPRGARSSRRAQESSPWSTHSHTAALRNPILEREMRSRWRRPLTYVVLFFYTATLAWVAWQLASTAMEQSAALAGGYATETVTALPGAALFAGSVRAQVLVALWASALLCAPVVARERELKMLPELILANLSPAQIVRGKWLATLGFAAILLVIPLPLQALAFMLGGVSPGEWVGAVVLQVGAMVLGSALGMWCSTLTDRVARAMGIACVCAAIASVPLGAALANLKMGGLFSAGVGLACAVLALPLLAGAQRSLKYLPLEPLRPTAADTPTLQEIHRELKGERPSDPVAARTVAKQSQRAEERLARLQEEAASSREPWVFGVLKAVGWHNPIVWRDLRVSVRQPLHDIAVLLSVALCFMALPAMGSTLTAPGIPGSALAVVGMVWIVAGVACALGASQGFTREREQKMLEGLLLSTMSPLSIVAGKVASPILLALNACALPLALFAAWAVAWSLANGALIAGIAILGTLSFAFLGAACGTWLSFWCRTSSVSALGSIALFLGILVAPISTSHIGPQRFQDAASAFWGAWLSPLESFSGSPAFLASGTLLCAAALGLALAMLAHITATLRPKALEREGRSLLHADLTRNIR